jgi:hypothetical protein
MFVRISSILLRHKSYEIGECDLMVVVVVEHKQSVDERAVLTPSTVLCESILRDVE